MLRTSRMGLVLAGAIALSACGSDTVVNPSPPPPPSPTPPPPFVIYGDNGSVPADSAVYIDFAIPSAGTVAATVDWTFASSEVWVAMTTNACDDFILAFLGQCSHIGTPNLGNAKPKTVTGSVTQATSARLWIANFATVDESMAVQMVLTPRSASAPTTFEPLSGRWVLGPNAGMKAVRAQRAN